MRGRDRSALGNLLARVKAIYQDGNFHTSTANLPVGKPVGIILDRTNFYAESGGQENDTGSLTVDGTSTAFDVEDVQVYNGYVLHSGVVSEGTFNLDEEVVATYDELRRWPIRNNHTGTHILNFALREVLGDHIDQKGSLVAQKKLRFDFSHKQQVTVPELEKIEAICDDWVKRDLKVTAKEMPLKDAQAIPGLRAVFGEAYPDPVRVVVVGGDAEEVARDLENPKWRHLSVEFCGGTCVIRACGALFVHGS